MRRLFLLVILAGIVAMAASGIAQVTDDRGVPKNFVPVTQEMLLNPSPDDWLMFSRTYDSQRFSPLRQITKQNVGQLRMAWTRGIEAGAQETIPIVHRGVMYVVTLAPSVQALDATNGDVIWEYKRPRGPGNHTKGLCRSSRI